MYRYYTKKHTNENKCKKKNTKKQVKQKTERTLMS